MKIQGRSQFNFYHAAICKHIKACILGNLCDMNLQFLGIFSTEVYFPFETEFFKKMHIQNCL